MARIIDYLPQCRVPRRTSPSAIYDSAGKLVREYSTKPEEAGAPEPPLNVPDYWVGHPDPLDAQRGPEPLRLGSALCRAARAAARIPDFGSLRKHARTATRRDGDAWQLQGSAYGRMDAPTNSRSPSSMDPRVDVSSEALTQQLDLEQKIIDLVADSYEFYKKAVAFRQLLAGDQKELEKNPSAAAAVTALKEFDQKAARLQGADGGRGGGGGGRGGARPPHSRH